MVIEDKKYQRGNLKIVDSFYRYQERENFSKEVKENMKGILKQFKEEIGFRSFRS